MSKVIPLCSPWQPAADAADRLCELVADIPAGADSFEITAESEAELLEAATLLQRPLELLRRARGGPLRGLVDDAERLDDGP